MTDALDEPSVRPAGGRMPGTSDGGRLRRPMSAPGVASPSPKGWRGDRWRMNVGKCSLLVERLF